MKIQIISGSTRKGRGTPKVAAWVEKTAKEIEAEVEFEVVDLADYNLPFMTEPAPPMGNQNRQISDEAKRWLEKLGQADGFIIVTPEYNHSLPATLKNAIDTLDFQLVKKPVAIVSHGSIGGARANEHLRLIINSNLGGVPVPESVTLKAAPAVRPVFTDDNRLLEEYASAQAPLEAVVKSVVWYAKALKAAKSQT